MKKILLLLIASITLLMNYANAVRESRPTSLDARIRVITFHPNDVFKFTGYYGYQSSIELAIDEEVISISLGDTSSWQVVPSGHRIFLKPIEDDATTNMTIVTNKHTYFFELYAEETQDIRDPAMIFSLRFIYPEEAEGSVQTFAKQQNSTIDLSQPELLNFNYTVSGSDKIAPVKIFDDGEFTYLEFKKNYQLPAIFSVDEELRESIVNSRIDSINPNLIIVEEVFSKLSLRAGDKILCIFNEAKSNEAKQ